MGCNCGNSTYEQEEEIANIMSNEENKVLILYTHPNIGKKIVKSPTTMVSYGYYGGGSVFRVLKDDARLRPGYFGTCGNCRQPLTITPQDVFCPRCSKIKSTSINRPAIEKVVKAVQEIEPDPEPTPDPEPIGTKDITEEQLQTMMDSTGNSGTKLEDIDWGRSLNKRHLSLLEAKGITTLEQAHEAGSEKLQEINGIGPKIVDTIMSRA